MPAVASCFLSDSAPRIVSCDAHPLGFVSMNFNIGKMSGAPIAPAAHARRFVCSKPVPTAARRRIAFRQAQRAVPTVPAEPSGLNASQEHERDLGLSLGMTAWNGWNARN
jgi:hypothetical protein